MLQKVLAKLDGLHYPQEYLCLDQSSFTRRLNVYVFEAGKIKRDVTSFHLFTGYSPLIISLYSSVDEQSEVPPAVELVFTPVIQRLNENISKKDAIARLSLQLRHQQVVGNTVIGHYEGIKGEHCFTSFVQQFFGGISNRLYKQRAGNVFLPGNRYRQVQIAYAIPRTISLITVAKDGTFNLFPTDLHGPLSDTHYICSLRHAGKAARQVETTGQIVVSELDGGAFKMVYALGKNHMQPMKTMNNFPFGKAVSGLLRLPLPLDTVAYRELILEHTWSYGIHKLLLFKVAGKKAIQENPRTLGHIHNAYATWLYNKGLAGNYLIR